MVTHNPYECPSVCGCSCARIEIERLRAALEKIAVVCTNNMDRSCDHRMALDFVRQVANDATAMGTEQIVKSKDG